jgi:hypothetical protein
MNRLNLMWRVILTPLQSVAARRQIHDALAGGFVHQLPVLLRQGGLR